MASDILNLDYESRSEIDLKKRGLDVYSNHSSTRILMAGYSINGSRPVIEDNTYDRALPAELIEALKDPHVIKKAFNAQFERVMTERVLGIKTPISSWRCTQVLAYQLGFAGGLDQIGRALRFTEDKAKDADGKRLIRMFSMPQRVTRNQPCRWRDAMTDPDDWDQFLEYCRQDVVTEMAVDRRLSPYPVIASEWDLYHLDQLINDNGLPLDRQFIINAIEMAEQRKAELLQEMKMFTGLANPGSDQQMRAWLEPRGYPFKDLSKDTVSKVLREKDENGIDEEAVIALKMRANYQKRSIKKYDTMINAMGDDDRFRYAFQMSGASRTGRWAGRKIQAQNLPRTPKTIEDIELLSYATQLVRDNDYETLKMFNGEPMGSLSGLIRSSIRAPEGKHFVVCDLSSIETAVIAWLAQCTRLLNVFRDGRCPYRDFATDFFKLPYEETLGTPRTQSKPAVLGCGFRLGGGMLLPDGKKTGLWAYAENMGVMLTREAAHEAVNVYRNNFTEVCDLWTAYENAAKKCLATHRDVDCGFVTFRWMKPFLAVRLPSGRYLYYYRPRIAQKVMPSSRAGEDDWVTEALFYEGMIQNTSRWGQVDSHGGKLVENFVQAIARDILKRGLRRAHQEGFEIVGHVHDEIITLVDDNDDYHNLPLLRSLMIEPINWAQGMPLNAAGWEGLIYRKD